MTGFAWWDAVAALSQSAVVIFVGVVFGLLFLKLWPAMGSLGDLFSRRKRIERRHLVIRGPHYPRKTVVATYNRWTRWTIRSKYKR